jgi:carboxyl-terminal processing protease
MTCKQRVWRLTSILILAGLLLALTEVFAAKQPGTFKQLDLLLEVRHELVSSYVDEPDEMQMIEAAVEGMVESLRDPYTVFVPNKYLEQFEDRLTGSFSGIGAEIDVQDGLPRIVTPLEDSPAWKAGIAAGDMILAVDGEPTQGVNLMDIIKQIKGEAGTDVVLKVRRVTGAELDIAITRAQINVQTVRGARRKADQSYDFMLDPESKIGYVRLSQFTEPTADDLRSALDSLNEQGARGLILDLRFDPGGLLSTAVKVSDMFLTEGKRIVSTNGRAWPEQVFDSSDDTVMPDLPMVVLANERSASASEVVTGALSDNGRALFVGTRTFGKGSVQQVRGLDSGLGALKMTGAYYYLPSGRNIHKKPDAEVWGVDPDEGAYVPMTFEQYEQMILARREADTVRKDNGHGLDSPVTPEYVETEMKDPQLAAGLRAVLGKLESGDWPTVGLSNAEELVKQHDRELLQRRRNLLLEELHKVEAELADSESEDEAMAPGAAQLFPMPEPSLDTGLERVNVFGLPEIAPEAELAPVEQPTPETQPELVPEVQADPIEEPATEPEPATQP